MTENYTDVTGLELSVFTSVNYSKLNNINNVKESCFAGLFFLLEVELLYEPLYTKILKLYRILPLSLFGNENFCRSPL